MSLGFTCGPEAALAEYPCMNTLPDKAIIAVIAVVSYYMAATRQGTGDADTIAACDPCWNALSNHDKLVALANIMLSWAVDNGYMTAVQAEAAQSTSCLLNLSEQELFAIILCWLCTFFTNITVGPV